MWSGCVIHYQILVNTSYMRPDYAEKRYQEIKELRQDINVQAWHDITCVVRLLYLPSGIGRNIC